jgi:glycosyltransferase involved in cell wall biosynthesis
LRSESSSALPKNTLRRLESLGSMDIVIGIPSYNCAHTINYVIYQTARGLAEFFPDRNAVIIISDGGSSDGTLDVVKAIKVPWQTKIVPTLYVGISGKGTALRAIFEAMIHLDAQAVMVVDSDLRSIVPQWVELLLSSTLKGTGLVTPLYTRHKYDGTITNFLCYPFTRVLYGRRVRQPIGGDFGLSRRLVENLLSSSLWRTPYVPRFGIDIFETHTALGKGFKVKQAILGSKVHDAKDPSKHLASMFHDVAGAMFSCTEIYEDAWRNVQGSKLVEVTEEEVHATAPEEIQVDFKKLFQGYTAGFQMFRDTYEKVLSPELLRDLKGLRVKNEDDFRFPTECWAKCMYSFATAFKKKSNVKERNNLLEALRFLWMGKVASFILESSKFDEREAEEKIEEEADVFEKLKPYLLDIY